MAFNQTTASNNKAVFSIELHSRKTDHLVGWVNLPDSFVSGVFKGCSKVRDLTCQEVSEKLSGYYDNDRIYSVIVDTTATKETVELEDF